MTDPHISGKYSELMATAAFIADGRQVALPCRRFASESCER